MPARAHTETSTFRVTFSIEVSFPESLSSWVGTRALCNLRDLSVHRVSFSLCFTLEFSHTVQADLNAKFLITFNDIVNQFQSQNRVCNNSRQLVQHAKRTEITEQLLSIP